MELKVWVDGIQRIVCGVTHATTCQDVVFALAHATSTTGRFTLIERWRSNERLLAPTQHPLKVLLKWGEHASDVQFILQRTALDCQTTTATSKASPSATQALANLPSAQQEQYQPTYHQHSHQHHQQQLLKQQQQFVNNANNNISVCHNDSQQQQHYRHEQLSHPDSTQQGSPNHITAQAQRCISPPFGHGGVGSGRDLRKSLTFSGGALGRSAAGSREGGKWPRHCGPNESTGGGQQLSESHYSTNGGLPSPDPPHPGASSAHASCGATIPSGRSDHTRPPTTTGHEAASNLSSLPANGHQPFGSPSHPSTDPSQRQVNGVRLSSSSSSDPNLLMGGGGGPANRSREATMEEHSQLADTLGQHVPRALQGTAIMGRQVEHVVLDGIHRDLVNLVNLQRDKLTGQQVQLTKFEAEITYLEGRWREDQAKLSYANAEMERLSHLMQQLEREVSEDELRQQELHLGSAVTGEQRLKEQLSALQRQVQECDGRVLHLQDSIRSLEEEMASLRDSQLSVMEASAHQSDSIADDSDAAELAKQLEAVERALAGKREQVEELKRAMMTENLEALSLTPPDTRAPVPLSAAAAASSGGAAGSSRRMLGSPRMLETAVPTSKNPHGVWV